MKNLEYKLPRNICLATVMSLGALSAAFAQSETSKGPVTQDAAKINPKVRVPIRDMRGVEVSTYIDSVRTASIGHVVIIYDSDNREVFELVRETARSAITDGLPLKGIIVSDVYPESQIQILAGGQLVSVEREPFENFQTKIDIRLEEAFSFAVQDISSRQEEASRAALLKILRERLATIDGKIADIDNSIETIDERTEEIDQELDELDKLEELIDQSPR